MYQTHFLWVWFTKSGINAIKLFMNENILTDAVHQKNQIIIARKRVGIFSGGLF